MKTLLEAAQDLQVAVMEVLNVLERQGKDMVVINKPKLLPFRTKLYRNHKGECWRESMTGVEPNAVEWITVVEEK